MKCSRSDVRSPAHALPRLQFECHALTSFSGLVLFQKLFAVLNLKSRIAACFRHVRSHKVFSRQILFLQLIVHLLLGFREVNHCRYYKDDPLVQRVLGLKKLPDMATLSRMLKEADEESIYRLRVLLREMVGERLRELRIARVTLDFDGSVQSTKRRAQGTAVGFNKKKKGSRSYYPLFCTIAQTGQVLDYLHRPGNVHDSHGAKDFILACIDVIRTTLPGVVVEVRMDSAFFSDEMVTALNERRIEFTLSVPFERFPKLKGIIESRRRWRRMDQDTSYFEVDWKPASWSRRYRFLVIRTRTKKQQKGAVQLDLFVPHEFGYEFKVIVSNKTTGSKHVTRYHEGRGSQEAVFGELKSHCHLDYVPVRRLNGNQMYLLAGLFAYNLTREFQMRTTKPARGTTVRRATLWVFERVDTVRKTMIQRAGRFTRPSGTLTLTISAAEWIRDKLLENLTAIDSNA
jgi:hypothetical protein